jgi:hypothetical protein
MTQPTNAERTGKNRYNTWPKREFSEKLWIINIWEQDAVGDPGTGVRTTLEEPQEALEPNAISRRRRRRRTRKK